MVLSGGVGVDADDPTPSPSPKGEGGRKEAEEGGEGRWFIELVYRKK